MPAHLQPEPRLVREAALGAQAGPGGWAALVSGERTEPRAPDLTRHLATRSTGSAPVPWGEAAGGSEALRGARPAQAWHLRLSPSRGPRAAPTPGLGRECDAGACPSRPRHGRKGALWSSAVVCPQRAP